jgi:hypothetical protein
MTTHTENSLRRSRILQVLNLALAVPTSEAPSAKGLIPSKNRKILNFVAASRTAVSTAIANE